MEIIHIADGVPYPETLTISSRGGVADKLPQIPGVYKKTNDLQFGRPVWKNTFSADDRYLFYRESQKGGLLKPSK